MDEKELEALKNKSVDELIEIIDKTYLALKFVPGFDIETVKVLAGITAL